MKLNNILNSRIFNVALLTIVVSSMVLYFQTNNYMGYSNDIWHVLNVGRQIIEHGFYGYSDPFVVQNYEWNPQQWLSGVIYIYIIVVLSHKQQ